MENDFSKLQFNKNHKIDSAALDVITGLRLAILAFCINALLGVIAINASVDSPFLPAFFAAIPALITFLLSVAAFACGAYGCYLVVEALGWAGYIVGFFVVSLLIPFLRLIGLIVVIVKAFELIGNSAYRFSLFGKPRKRES